MQPNTNPRIAQEPVSVDQIDIQVVEPPPILQRVARQTVYYTVGAILEPQEPRYSSLCVFLSLLFVGVFSLLFKRC